MGLLYFGSINSPGISFWIWSLAVRLQIVITGSAKKNKREALVTKLSRKLENFLLIRTIDAHVSNWRSFFTSCSLKIIPRLAFDGRKTSLILGWHTFRPKPPASSVTAEIWGRNIIDCFLGIVWIIRTYHYQ